MQIEPSKRFRVKLEIIFDYIAKDKLLAAKKFKKELFQKIEDIPNFPYKYRKSFYFDDDNIRDMIFKKYTIVYEVDLESNQILILDVFNRDRLD